MSFALETLVVHSLYKVFPEEAPTEGVRTHYSCLANEPLSFQIAYHLLPRAGSAVPINVRITTELPISLYAVGYVPVLQTSIPDFNDHYRPGLFPDRLLEKRINPRIVPRPYPWSECYHVEEDPLHLFARSDSWQSIFVTVNERGRRISGGEYPIKVEFFSQPSGAKLGESELTVKVIPVSLPKQTLKCTNWFHVDCLCDAHGVEPFSERFFEIFADYAKKAALNGMNLLLTPCFTPPLDTPVGGERRTVQLVGVTFEGGEYSFDFSLLETYIRVAMKNGIEYFEHSHLFTQWGAKHAPKIMACVGGKERRIFGWETDSKGPKYKKFLQAYLRALLAFLRERGWDRRFVFHLSDEPSPSCREHYLAARAAVGNLLDGYIVGDAISHYEMYEDGTVSTPIVTTTNIKNFYGRAKHLWAYYTGGQRSGGFSNRMLNCSGERNRMLGIQMYMHDIEGFLHWGYNYWYDILSQGYLDPNTDGALYGGTNPGTSFLVYPSPDGMCIQSIRQKVFYEGINDMRALLRLERLAGKAAARAFVTDYFGEVTFDTHPGTAERLLSFRESLNERIAAEAAGKSK